MVSYLKETWSTDPKVKHWVGVSCVQDSKCGCGEDNYLIELWEHDSCTRGRIDTTVCVKCNRVKSFKVIR